FVHLSSLIHQHHNKLRVEHLIYAELYLHSYSHHCRSQLDIKLLSLERNLYYR
uniref:Uncharacterized protein n=1 Tax=Ciona intestinalis TaxID=7719 RepID=H2Y3A5_CIOIN